MKRGFHVTAAWSAEDEPGGFTPEDFPGRWNPVRSFPEGLELLPTVAGKALARAGWWRQGSGETCTGGLVVGADGGFFGGSLAFARQIQKPYSLRVSPSDFVRALPSTPASLLSMLFGLGDYQATLLQGPSSGVLALGHALDLVTLGRLERALVVVLSESERSGSLARIAVAMSIATSSGETSTAVEIEIGRTQGGTAEAKASSLQRRLNSFGPLAALPLAELAIWLERPARERRGFVRQTAAGESVTVTARASAG